MTRVVLLSIVLVAMGIRGLAHGAEYVIGASPGVAKEQGTQLAQSIAILLGRVTGDTFSYAPTTHWPGYIEAMRNSGFSLLFDEPHLVSWRLENQRHIPLVKLSGNMSFVIVARRDDETIVQLTDVAGHTVCAGVPPALDGLILFEQFENPSRQPRIKSTRSAQEAHENLVQEECRAAVLPTAHYESLQNNGKPLRVLFLSRSFPNWTLSADNRVPALDEIREALLDPANGAEAIISELYPGARLLPANENEYKGLARLLEGFWGLP